MGGLPAVLALAVAAAVAGCGGASSQSKSVSPAVLAAAVKATQATGGYALAVGGTVDVQGQGFPIHGGGFVDARHNRGSLRVEVAGTKRTIDVKPERLLGYVRGVSAASRLETATVDGVRTTRYGATVDLPRYAQAASPDEVGALNELMRRAGDTIPVDVWIDAASRIRRVSARVTTADFAAVPQLDLRDFGRPGRP